MKKIVLSGSGETKSALINAIKAIGDTNTVVVIENFNIELSLVEKPIQDNKNEKIQVKWKGNYLNKLALVKEVKESFGIGLKEAKDIVDNLCTNYKELTIFEYLKFMEIIGAASKLSSEEFYEKYRESDIFQSAFEITFN